MDDGLVVIGQKVVGEAEFFLEGFLLFWVVGADTKHFEAMLGECAECISQAAGLFGASRGVGFWVEKDEQVATGANVVEADAFFILVEL